MKSQNSVKDKQSQLAWERVNEVSWRESASISKLKANKQEERFQKWKEHSKYLLEYPLKIPVKATKEIIYGQLDIKPGLFTEVKNVAVLK